MCHNLQTYLTTNSFDVKFYQLFSKLDKVTRRQTAFCIVKVWYDGFEDSIVRSETQHLAIQAENSENFTTMLSTDHNGQRRPLHLLAFVMIVYYITVQWTVDGMPPTWRFPDRSHPEGAVIFPSKIFKAHKRPHERQRMPATTSVPQVLSTDDSVKIMFPKDDNFDTTTTFTANFSDATNDTLDTRFLPTCNQQGCPRENLVCDTASNTCREVTEV